MRANRNIDEHFGKDQKKLRAFVKKKVITKNKILFMEEIIYYKITKRTVKR